MTPVGLALGFLLAAVVAWMAYRLGSLSGGGAMAATVVGGLTIGAGGALPGGLLILFFVSSSLLSRWGERRKRSVEVHFEKGGRRDEGQVLANGGVAALLALGYGLTSQPVFLAGIAGALAAATADTWATEIGVGAGRRPRLITTGRPAERGTSGAVSGAGILAAVGGAGFIGLAAAWGFAAPAAAMVVTVAGFLGAAIDSLLGATVQAMFYCPRCGKETERHPFHSCGTETQRIRGWPWLRNDGVNLAASLVGAMVAGAAWARYG